MTFWWVADWTKKAKSLKNHNCQKQQWNSPTSDRLKIADPASMAMAIAAIDLVMPELAAIALATKELR
ncbi:hypothetical protein NL676_008286 [Syzygium grande]|nr:hypothetical protein NL676_008286 [Syzygium grande]